MKNPISVQMLFPINRRFTANRALFHRSQESGRMMRRRRGWLTCIRKGSTDTGMIEPIFGLNPVSFVIIKFLPFIILLFILLNMIQKRFLRNWEPKRLATLYLIFVTGGIIIVSVFVVRFGLPDFIYIPLLPAVAALLIVKRKHFFPFSIRCGSCGKMVTPRELLCSNDNLCAACRGKNPGEE
jgi:hypothetical protein